MMGRRRRLTEARLQALEDSVAIYQLISGYGPAVDSGSVDKAAAIWTENGIYEIPGIGVFVGRDQIAALFRADLHQTLIRGGAGHVLSLPNIELSGDRAVATNYGRVYVPSDGGFGVFRMFAARWELARTEDGWRCLRRVNELLDGRQEARSLLRASSAPV